MSQKHTSPLGAFGLSKGSMPFKTEWPSKRAWDPHISFCRGHNIYNPDGILYQLECPPYFLNFWCYYSSKFNDENFLMRLILDLTNTCIQCSGWELGLFAPSPLLTCRVRSRMRTLRGRGFYEWAWSAPVRSFLPWLLLGHISQLWSRCDSCFIAGLLEAQSCWTNSLKSCWSNSLKSCLSNSLKSCRSNGHKSCWSNSHKSCRSNSLKSCCSYT